MASTGDFKNGMCIEFNGGLWTIVEFQHVKPGKGPAFVRSKLKNVQSGKVVDNTFTAGAKIKEARVERRPYQFLYKDDSGFHFMHTENYEQIFLQEDAVPTSELLKDGQKVEILVHAETEEILSCDLPQFVELEITYTEPGVKGDTATNTFKPATMETGAIVKVPLFIGEGEKIRIDTKTGEYMERVK
jgi:elongation factor P